MTTCPRCGSKGLRIHNVLIERNSRKLKYDCDLGYEVQCVDCNYKGGVFVDRLDAIICALTLKRRKK